MKHFCTEYCVKALSYNCCYFCEGKKYCIEKCKKYEENIEYEKCEYKEQSMKTCTELCPQKKDSTCCIDCDIKDKCTTQSLCRASLPDYEECKHKGKYHV